MEYNIYCDESCHMYNDKNDIMVLGGIRCPAEYSKEINRDIIEIKTRFGFSPYNEIKWIKVSPSNIDYFIELIDYFFDNPNLKFRGYVARGKSEVCVGDQVAYNDWYYKIYYRLFEYIFDRDMFSRNNLYIDIKDTIGYEKVVTLKNYLNSHYRRDIVNKAQLVDSSDVALVQLADLFIGALSYRHRGLETSNAKVQIVKHIEALNNSPMLSSVPYRNDKANWFIWTPESWR